jgi:serine phosphatase RsbU (regulator of sigma subunit)
MKKKGIVLILAGVVLMITGIAVIQYKEKNPVPYFVLLAGVLGAFFGLSFLFFEQPLPKRKKSALILLLIGMALCVFITTAFICRWHIPGLSPLAIFTGCFLSFTYLPLLTKNRIEKWMQFTDKTWHAALLSIGDLIGLAGLIIGYLFKEMHWPGAGLLIVVGITILALSLFGWNKVFGSQIIRIKIAEEKLQDILTEVKEKNREITDSINYAKRIQEAIIPSIHFIQESLPESFIFYRPKDIVAGDFYWAERTGDIFLIAVADCTGHGVPGALVSVVCCNALNRAVKEFNLIEPGQILDKTRELVLESFSKNGGNIQDGMDISLLSIHGNEVKWAGANNPLWMVSANESQLKEIKADKQPIGKTDNPSAFTTHCLNVKNGDIFYLFTDGYADQFGGPKGKKFKYKQLEEFLLEVQSEPMEEQYHKLVKKLSDWKRGLEQVDDVCVIGIRF